MTEERPPERSGQKRVELHPAVPYLWMLGLAGLIGIFLLAYLWQYRDEIIAILRQSPT